MDRSPEEYGRYWRGSLRITAGVLAAMGGYRLAQPLFLDPGLGTTLFGWLLFALVLAVATYLGVLGLARVIETAAGTRR